MKKVFKRYNVNSVSKALPTPGKNKLKDKKWLHRKSYRNDYYTENEQICGVSNEKSKQFGGLDTNSEPHLSTKNSSFAASFKGPKGFRSTSS